MTQEGSGPSPNPEEAVERALHRERERRRQSLLVARRRDLFLRAALVGVVAGLVGVLFQWSLFGAESFARWLRELLSSWGFLGAVSLAGVGACAGGASAWMTRRYNPAAAGSGIPNLKAVLLQLRPIKWKSLLPVKFFGGVLAIGGGMSLGREGPTVQMGGAVGAMLADLLRAPKRGRRQLIASGAGAGLAAAFNAPLAGFVFVLEELQREMSALTYGMALTAAVAGDIVVRYLVGQLPSFSIKNYPTPPLTALPAYVLVGVLCGLVAVLFNHMIVNGRSWLTSFRVPGEWLPWIVGGIAGLVLWFLPDAAGGGHFTAERILRGEVNGVGLILAIFVVKFLLTGLSYAAGVPGGIFAPMLVLGSLIGLAVGKLSGLAFPLLGTVPAAFAVVGMAAFFAGSVRAPLTGIVLILEMTQNYEQLLPLLLASLIAYFIADTMSKPVYDALLEKELNTSGIVVEESDPVLFHVAVEVGSRMDGSKVKELGLPQGVLLVSIRRHGQEIIPKGDTRILAGDEVAFIAAGSKLEEVQTVREAATAEG
ncbi:MAG: H(+)/Cl(-) exchange transporter ClcA [Armatimonadetes bacterium]|nr:MAG: H(+)/Cl(-) exchange transporter ClcA [Armatimonadota bacterium]